MMVFFFISEIQANNSSFKFCLLKINYKIVLKNDC